MDLLEKGKELYNSGKFEEAIECFNQAKDASICDFFEEKCISLIYIDEFIDNYNTRSHEDTKSKINLMRYSEP
jgi:hypothetical protein